MYVTRGGRGNDTGHSNVHSNANNNGNQCNKGNCMVTYSAAHKTLTGVHVSASCMFTGSILCASAGLYRVCMHTTTRAHNMIPPPTQARAALAWRSAA